MPTTGSPGAADDGLVTAEQRDGGLVTAEQRESTAW